MKHPFIRLTQARLRDRQRTWAPDRPAPSVPSPCVGVCRMAPSPEHPEPLCSGCLRTVPEIAGWSKATDDGKLAIWAVLERRHDALQSASSSTTKG
jgi:uncharacterized protein